MEEGTPLRHVGLLGSHEHLTEIEDQELIVTRISVVVCICFLNQLFGT